MIDQEMDYLISQVAELIVQSKRVVVFTGAGVSTESGIPDFRGPDGIWTKYDPEDFTLQKFLADPETRKLHWRMFGEAGLSMDADPNPAHHAVAELERMGKLDCVITQNVDGLHQKAGNSEDKVLQLHGNMSSVKCLSCGKRWTMAEVMERVQKGEELPECDVCHGILKPEAIFFGEAMPVWETSESERRSQDCDLCIVIGSSLVVYPAAFMPRIAVQSGAKLVIINEEPTDLDRAAHVRISGKAGVVMSRVMEKVLPRLGA